ncbi:LCP family protein [Actinomyces sp. MRS3W]|uniref:LCP family protein n=1 Tax=Actinomyces sp. MRS3W TaxID=2800796 RepID=UPI0028FD5210|nr:LCP family protein [Actinomyces sp. MRS3W]MDU0347646.1 LCP family protein [Actinomyces sp. MRS3W]
MASHESSPRTSHARIRVHRALSAWWTRIRALYRRRPLITGMVTVLVVLAVLGIGDLGILYGRLDRLDVTMPTGSASATDAGAQADTWLIIGTDSRTALPDGPNRYGTVAEVGDGVRADVAALVRATTSGLDVLVLPRDLVVVEGSPFDERLATSYIKGPQYTVDALCTAYGIATTHVVAVDMAQFANIVDSMGGVTVDIDEPVRDAYSGLEITTAGTRTLSGIDALALVRSRHPEVLRKGQWVALSEQEGAERRSQFTGVVMRALLTTATEQARSPLAVHSLAWTLTGNLGVDTGTGLLDLVHLARKAHSHSGEDGGIKVVNVPAGPVEDSFAAPPTDETYAVLAEYGFTPGACTPAS